MLLYRLLKPASEEIVLRPRLLEVARVAEDGRSVNNFWYPLRAAVQRCLSFSFIMFMAPKPGLEKKSLVLCLLYLVLPLMSPVFLVEIAYSICLPALYSTSSLPSLFGANHPNLSFSHICLRRRAVLIASDTPLSRENRISSHGNDFQL